jgi:DNA-binding MurR/RpiR family transcriptional regulator
MSNSPTLVGHLSNARLLDPEVRTVSLSEAAGLLGISKSTAARAAAATGYVVEGVPALRVAANEDPARPGVRRRSRYVVATVHLRRVLGIELVST